MASFYSEIESNKRKSWVLVFLFVIVVVAVGYAFGELAGYSWLGLPLAFLLVVPYSFVAYYYSDQMVLTLSGARPVDHNEYPYLDNVVEGLAIAAGIPKPKAYVINDPAPNAFATGRDPQHAAIAVTSGLLKQMNRQELEGVVAHEMSHVRNYDTRLMVIATVFVGIVSLLAGWGLRMFMWGGIGGGNRDRRGGGNAWLVILSIVLMVLAPLFAQLIHLAISRKREFLADASAAQLTRYPEGLASALEKIGGDRNKLGSASEATAHLYIVNPLKGSAVSGLFSTHPPIAERTRILRSM